MALTGKKVSLDDFDEEVIRSPELGKLVAEVKVVVDPDFKGSLSIMGPIKIKVRMKDGREYSHREELAKGHPRNQMSEAEFAEKFKDCTRCSAKPIPQQNIDKVLDLLNKLEKVDDIGKVVRLLT